MFTFKLASRQTIILGAISFLGFSGVSWTDSLIHSAGINYDLFTNDTIPKNERQQTEHNDARSLEEHISEIEKARNNLNRELSQKDWDKVEAEMENALARINSKELEAQMDMAIAELQRNKANLDLAKIEKSMAQAAAEMDRAKLALNNSKIDLKESLHKANEKLIQVHAEMEAYHKMVASMKKEGLIADIKNYRIEFNQNKLLINGKEQPKEVSDRYKKYFKPGKTILVNEDDHFDLKTEKPAETY